MKLYVILSQCQNKFQHSTFLRTSKNSKNILKCRLCTSSLQAAVQSALCCVQQLPGRLPKLTVTASQVKGGHGCWAELLQQCVKEARGLCGASAQPVAFLQ